MRYCPQCDAEYRDDRPACTDDGTALLNRAAYEADLVRQGRKPLDFRRLTAIATVDDSFEADALAKELTGQGFHVAVVASKPQTMGVLTSPGPTTWSLVVPDAEAERASVLLTEWRAGLESSAGEAEAAAVAEEAAGETAAQSS